VTHHDPAAARRPSERSGADLLTALVADRQGRIFELNGYAAVAMAGAVRSPLHVADTVNLPFGSELMLLPDRRPVLYNIERRRLEVVEAHPLRPGVPIFPVAAFNSPGFVVTAVSAYTERPGAGYLPLFSYGAVGWHRGGFRSAVLCIDRERRQDIRLMKPEDVQAGIHTKRRQLPQNRLRRHLETCALTYGCPAGKNFFLGRYEAPLPTARTCNARCRGCLSRQTGDAISHCQERISFTPSPEEIAEVALSHINSVKRSVVSFGQGCEGEPLLSAEVIAPAIRLIRSATGRGTINLNTNGSRPDRMETLFDAGLDSVRVSLNSLRQAAYNAYFRPSGYRFADVLTGIANAIRRGKFVSINYLNCPGFTDTHEEYAALARFLRRYPIQMIQWRNLNFDPLRYWRIMGRKVAGGRPMGADRLIRRLRSEFPQLRHGYFNPPRESFQTS
jgi:pyruvate-formate lyase-activating enzyme